MHLPDQPILTIFMENMYNVLVALKIPLKVYNIRSKQFRYSENS